MNKIITFSHTLSHVRNDWLWSRLEQNLLPNDRPHQVLRLGDGFVLHRHRRVEHGSVGGRDRTVQVADLAHVQHGFVVLVVILGPPLWLFSPCGALFHHQQRFVDLLAAALQDVVADDEDLEGAIVKHRLFKDFLFNSYRLAVLVVQQIANKLTVHHTVAPNLQVSLQLHDAPFLDVTFGVGTAKVTNVNLYSKCQFGFKSKSGPILCISGNAFPRVDRTTRGYSSQQNKSAEPDDAYYSLSEESWNRGF